MKNRTIHTLAFLLVILSGAAQLKTTLPIVVINTNGNQIVDEPKVMADMKIIHKGNEQENVETDTPNIYNGKIGIEYRGSTSQSFPKKPFGFETWNAQGEDLKVSWFGWPEESDWILFASYNEKSLMHNVLSMRLAREIGLYASRTQYVEVVLNGSYQGVYILMEKVKRDKGRVDISKLTTSDISGDDLTGGYIIKIDKSTGNNIGSWRSTHALPSGKTQQLEYFYEYPNDIVSEQKNYIRNYVTNFETAVKSSDFADPTTGYRKYIDTKSFIQVFLINEIARNIDGYRISTFMYKDKDSKGGKLKMGPPWDYDISYGNANYCQGSRFDLFAYKFNAICPDDYWLVPFWWDKFMQDPGFLSEVRDMYQKERKDGAFTDANLTKIIDELTKELQVPQTRNFQKWQILGTYVWPQPEPIARTWQDEVNELRTWLSARMKWLDGNMPGVYVGNEVIPELSVTAFPNPFIDVVNVALDAQKPTKATLIMYDANGREHIRQTNDLQTGKNIINLQVPHYATFQSLQFLSVEIDGKKTVKKLVQGQ